jgi:hypothetical protein
MERNKEHGGRVVSILLHLNFPANMIEHRFCMSGLWQYSVCHPHAAAPPAVCMERDKAHGSRIVSNLLHLSIPATRFDHCCCRSGLCASSACGCHLHAAAAPAVAGMEHDKAHGSRAISNLLKLNIHASRFDRNF